MVLVPVCAGSNALENLGPFVFGSLADSACELMSLQCISSADVAFSPPLLPVAAAESETNPVQCLAQYSIRD